MRRADWSWPPLFWITRVSLLTRYSVYQNAMLCIKECYKCFSCRCTPVRKNCVAKLLGPPSLSEAVMAANGTDQSETSLLAGRVTQYVEWDSFIPGGRIVEYVASSYVFCSRRRNNAVILCGSYADLHRGGHTLAWFS